MSNPLHAYGSPTQRSNLSRYSGLLATTCMVGLALANHKAQAAPTVGNVVGGNASITITGTATNITQTTARAAIDWHSFSIAANESVNFTVPDQGATLNRVTGGTPSLIQGSLTSNGTLYLVNPNGLVFAVGSSVSAKNFIATTSNIDPNQFMRGDHITLGASTANARIALNGTITVADRGVVGIFAPQVENQGIITANLGSIALAGVQSSTIDFTGDGLINFELGTSQDRTGETLLASNKGIITAAGGHVTLTAQGAENLFNAVVENTGTINANSLTAQGGTVTVKAHHGNIDNSGSIQASGDAGGGTVTVFADGNTNYTGTIHAEALAGGQKTDGGMVEVSGKNTIQFQGTVSTRSFNGGRFGSLLIDPSDIVIGSSATANATNSNNIYTGSANSSTILASALATALASNNIIVDATGGSGTSTTSSITVSSSVIWTANTALTLKAGSGGITINAEIRNHGAATGNDVYDGTPIRSGTLTLDSGGAITVAKLSGASAPDADITVATLNLRAATTITTFDASTQSGSGAWKKGLMNADHLNLNAAGGDVKISGYILNLDSYNQTTGNFSIFIPVIFNTPDFNINCVVNNGTRDVSLKTASNHLVIKQDVTGGTVSLSGTAKSGETGVAPDARYLIFENGAKVNATQLNIEAKDGNVTISGAIDNVNVQGISSAVSLNLTSSKALTINGYNSMGNSPIIKTTGPGNGITIDGHVAGSAMTLESAGGISFVSGQVNNPKYTAGGIYAQYLDKGLDVNTLAITAAGDVTLSGKIDSLSGYSQTTGSFALTSAADFSLGTSINKSTQDFSFNTTNGAKLNFGNYNFTARDVTLSAAGEVSSSATYSLSVRNLTITNAGAVNMAGLNVSGTVTASAAGKLSLAGSLTTIGPLTQTASGDFSLSNNRNMGIITPTRGGSITGGISLTTTGGATLSLGSAAIDAGASDLALTTSQTGGFNLTKAITTTGTLTLNATSGGISGTGKLTAATLKGSASDDVVLTTSVTNLGDFAVSNGKKLTISNDKALTVTGNVNDGGGTVTLNATGGIATTGSGKITADTIKGSASDAVTLVTAVRNLGEFSISANKDFTLTNDGALNVTADVTATGGTLKLKTNSNSITLGADLAATTVNLVAANAVSGTGKITATTLTGSVAATTSLTTYVTNLGAFAVTGSGQILTLINTGDLTVTGAVSNAGGTVTLNAGGFIAGTGVITATTLTGSATGTVNLMTAVSNLGNFTVNPTAAAGGGSPTAHNFTLSNTGALAITGTVVDILGTISLTSTAGIAMGGQGAINTAKLSLSATGNVAVSGAIGALTGYTQGGGGGNLSLTSSGALAIAVALSNGTNNITLKASGDITQTAAISTAGTLKADAGTGQVKLNDSDNQISKLGELKGNGITVKNKVALTLGDDITSTSGAIVIDNSYGASDADKSITLGKTVTLTGGPVTLDLGGKTISSTLSGGTFADANFSLATTGSNLTILAGAFTYTKTGVVFDLSNGSSPSGSMSTVANGQYESSYGSVMVIGTNYTLNGTVYNAATVTAGRTAATVDSARLTSGAAIVTSGSVNANFGGDIYINGGSNLGLSNITSTGGRIYVLAGYSDTANALTLDAKYGIDIKGAINLGTNNFTLRSSQGAITQASGIITAGTLSASAMGGISLTGANVITGLGSLSNAGSGNIALTTTSNANVTAGASWSNLGRMITVTAIGKDVTLTGGLTVTATLLRLDLGSSLTGGGKILSPVTVPASPQTLTLSEGTALYYSGSQTGNSVSIALGAAGSFTNVLYQADSTGVTLGNDFTVTLPAAILSSTAGGIALTVIGDNVAKYNLGVRYGNGVNVTITNNDDALRVAAAKKATTYSSTNRNIKVGTKTYDLRTQSAAAYKAYYDANPVTSFADNVGSLTWIEGGTIQVTNNAKFAGSLVLNATGTSGLVVATGNAYAAASKDSKNKPIAAKPANNTVYANIYVAGSVTAGNHLTLLQTGTLTAAMENNAPAADAYGIYVAGGGLVATSGSVNLVQSGNVMSHSGATVGGNAAGIFIAGAIAASKGSINLVQTGEIKDTEANKGNATGLRVTAGLTNGTGLSLSSNGNITGATAAGINVTPGLSSSGGSVNLTQNGAVSGINSAYGILLNGNASAGGQKSEPIYKKDNKGNNVLVRGAPVVTGSKYIGFTNGSIMLTQKGDVTASTGGATGIMTKDLSGTSGVAVSQNADIASSGDGFGVKLERVTSSNGEVIITTAVGKKINATTGTATGIYLVSVSAGNGLDIALTNGTNPNSTITVTNEAAVTGEKNSATGLNSGKVELVASSFVPTPQTPAAVHLSNKGNVTATQNAAKLSVTALGINLTGEVKTGGAANNAIITNSGIITAKNMSDTAALAAASHAQLAAAALNGQSSITIAEKNYKLSTAAQKTAATKAYIDYLATLADLTGLPSTVTSGATRLVLNGANVTATGVALSSSAIGGNLAISNTNIITHGDNGSAYIYTVTATALNLTGKQSAGGTITLGNSGNVTGITRAVGVSASGGLNATQAVTITSDKTITAGTISGTAIAVNLTGSVAGKAVSITQSGGVTANAAYGIYENNTSMISTGGNVSLSSAGGVTGNTAYGIYGTNTSMISNAGNVSLSSAGGVTGTTLAAGIQLSEYQKPYVKGKFQGYNNVIATTGGDIILSQSGAVAAASGSASGITAHMLTSSGNIFITQNGAVTGANSAEKAAVNATANAVSLTHNATAKAAITIAAGFSTTDNATWTATTPVATITGTTANAILVAGSLTGATGVTVKANENVIGTTGAVGIYLRDAVTSTNGAITIATTANMTVTAATGVAQGIVLNGAVISGNGADNDAAKLTNLGINVTQNAAVTATANSAYGLVTGIGAVSLVNGLAASNVSALALTNNGNVTANQSLANLSVMAYGVKINGNISGGSWRGNHASISNGGTVKAVNLAASNPNLINVAEALAAALKKATEATTYSNSNKTIKIGRITYNLKTQAKAAYNAYLAANPPPNPAPEFTGTDSDQAATILSYFSYYGSTVAATGIALGNSTAGGNLTITNNGAVTRDATTAQAGGVINATAIALAGNQTAGAALAINNQSGGTVTAGNLSGTAYGISLTGGALTSNSSTVSVTNAAAVSGQSAATGISLPVNTQSIYNSKNRTSTPVTLPVVTAFGTISLDQSGAVTAAGGNAVGLVTDIMNSNTGSVSLTQSGNVTGTNGATAVNLAGAVVALAGGVTVTQGGNISSASGTAIGLNQTGSVTAAGALSLSNSGNINSKDANNATALITNGLSSFQDIRLTQTGMVNHNGTGTATGIKLMGKVTAGGNLIVTHAGAVNVATAAAAEGATAGKAIAVALAGANAQAYNDLTVTISGTVQNGSFDAVTGVFTAAAAGSQTGVSAIHVAGASTLSGSAAGYSWVTLRSNNLNLQLDSQLTVNKAEIRVDLNNNGTIAGNNQIVALGLNLYYTGAAPSVETGVAYGTSGAKFAINLGINVKTTTAVTTPGKPTKTSEATALSTSDSVSAAKTTSVTKSGIKTATTSLVVAGGGNFYLVQNVDGLPNNTPTLVAAPPAAQVLPALPGWVNAGGNSTNNDNKQYIGYSSRNAVTVTGAANTLYSYVEGTTITVAAGTSFSKNVTFNTIGGAGASGGFNLNGNLTINVASGGNGAVSIFTHGGNFALGDNATISTPNAARASGAADTAPILVNLGGNNNGGSFSNGGFTLTTSNHDLKVLAGAWNLTSPVGAAANFKAIELGGAAGGNFSTGGMTLSGHQTFSATSNLYQGGADVPTTLINAAKTQDNNITVDGGNITINGVFGLNLGTAKIIAKTGTITVSGASSFGSAVSLETSAAGQAIFLNAALNLATFDLTLNSGGAIIEAGGGAITARNLTILNAGINEPNKLTSDGTINLGGANAINNIVSIKQLGVRSVTTTPKATPANRNPTPVTKYYGNGLTINNTLSLTVGTITRIDGAGVPVTSNSATLPASDVKITTTGAYSNLTLSSAVGSVGNLTLAASGNLTVNGDQTSAAGISLSAGGSITAGGKLTTAATAAGRLTATAQSGAVNLTGVVTANNVSASAGGAVTINNGGNQITNFGAISGVSFDIGSAIEFTLTGNLTATASSGGTMKISNYGAISNILIAKVKNGLNASGQDLSFGFNGTGQFGGDGTLNYYKAGATGSPFKLNVPSLNPAFPLTPGTLKIVPGGSGVTLSRN